MLAALMVHAFVEDPPYLRQRFRDAKVDYPGILFLAMWLGLLQIVLDRGQRSDWFSAPWVCWFSFFSALGMMVLIFHELRFPDPILDLRIVGIRDFTTSVALVTVMMFVMYGVNLMNPLFLQQLLGYDAWRAGLAVAPRGIGVMISMMAVGQLSRLGFDTRPGVGIGFALAAYAAWQMATWNLEVSLRAILWPVVLFGFAGGLIFPVISATALACVERSRMGFAASLYNMMRNTAAAVGISLVSNRLVSGAQVHQSYLVAHFTPFEAWRVSQAPPLMPGSPPFSFMHQLITGQQQPLGIVYRTVQAQALLLAYNDVYRLFAYIALCSFPAFCCFRARAAVPPAPHIESRLAGWGRTTDAELLGHRHRIPRPQRKSK